MIRVLPIGAKSTSTSFRGVTLLVAICLALFPVYWMVTLSTETQGQVVAARVRLLPTFHFFRGISHLAETPVISWLENSALISLGTAVLSIALAVFPAYALSRFRFRGAGTFGCAVFATQMLPPALLVVPLYVIFSRLVLIDNPLSLVLADGAFAMPIALWVIKGAIDGIPRELDEAGLVDGGSSFSVLMMVIMPLIRPAIAAAAIIAFFFGWNDFLFANTFMVTESRWTVTKGLASLFGQYSEPIPFIMASAVLFSIPPVLFFLLLQRQIVSGLTAGAIKA
jgi:multiple sugar transport system permease protein